MEERAVETIEKRSLESQAADLLRRLIVRGELRAGERLVEIPLADRYGLSRGTIRNLMIGRVLWDEFFSNHDWPTASVVAIAFLVLLVGPIAIYQHISGRHAEA